MVDTPTVPLAIVERAEHPALVPGSVELRFKVDAMPNAKWVADFGRARVHFDGAGTLDFLHIADPTVTADVIRWTVPGHLKHKAEEYVQQRIDQANEQAASEGEASPS
jgi:hypothetical protein